MQRHVAVRGSPLLALAIFAGVGACSGSSSTRPPERAATTATAAGSAVPSDAGTATTSGTGDAGTGNAPTTTLLHAAATPPRAVSVPADACLLLTGQEASQLAGATVVGTSSEAGSVAACKYQGKKATVSLAVTAFADVAGAHAQIRGTAHGVALTSFHVGQEAVVYPGGIKVRSATLVVTITAMPTPTTTALETAAATVVKQL